MYGPFNSLLKINLEKCGFFLLFLSQVGPFIGIIGFIPITPMKNVKLAFIILLNNRGSIHRSLELNDFEFSLFKNKIKFLKSNNSDEKNLLSELCFFTIKILTFFMKNLNSLKTKLHRKKSILAIMVQNWRQWRLWGFLGHLWIIFTKLNGLARNRSSLMVSVLLSHLLLTRYKFG